MHNDLLDGQKLHMGMQGVRNAVGRVIVELPDRRIAVKYLGDNRFEVTASENSSLQPGN